MRVIPLIKNNIHIILLGFFILLYITYMVTATFLRHDNFYSGRFDLGNMDQTVWNTINGRIFQATDADGTDVVSRLSGHADFLLILLSPFYLIWESPKMLLLLQSLAMGFAAIFVFLLAHHSLKNKTVALVLAASYLLNPSINYVNLYDFHAVSFAPLFIVGAFYFLAIKRLVWFTVFLILAGLTKENVWMLTGLIGGYAAWRTKFFSTQFIVGITTVIVSLSSFYYLIWVAIPQARSSPHFALSYYSEFGDSPSEVIKNIVLSPNRTLSIAFGEEKIEYLRKILLPFGFLPVLSPHILILAAPDLFINLLGSNPNLHQIYYQYTATITPFLVAAAVQAIRLMYKKIPKLPLWIISFYVIASTLYAFYQYGPLPGSKNPNTVMFTMPNPNRQLIKSALAHIPSGAAVTATNNLAAHLSYREKIYVIPNGIKNADWVLFLISDQSGPLYDQYEQTLVGGLKKDPNFILIEQKDNFWAFKRVASAEK